MVYYRTRPTTLVLIDGAPKLKWNERWGVEEVANSAFVIVKDADGKFYLYGGGRWYRSNALKDSGEWLPVQAQDLPPDFAKRPPGSAGGSHTGSHH